MPFPLKEDGVRGEAKVSGADVFSPSLLHDHASYDGGYGRGGKDLIIPSVSHSCIRIHSLDVFSHHHLVMNSLAKGQRE